MGGISVVADKVDFDSKVPADKFKVPAGYTIVDKEKNKMPGEGSKEESE
jgi:hypothetical protein